MVSLERTLSHTVLLNGYAEMLSEETNTRTRLACCGLLYHFDSVINPYPANVENIVSS